MSRLQRLAKSVERTLKTRGVVGTVVYAGSVAAERVRNRGAAKPAVAEADAAEDREFDEKYGVSTGGEIPQTELDVAEKNWVHGSAYVPTSPVDFDKVLGGLGITFEDTTFIDLGSGKGRVLLMAAALPFKKIIGVEFSPKLAEISRDNIERYTGPRKCTDMVAEINDATKYTLPDGPLVVFMYHPFDDKIMTQVEAHVARAAKASARRILVVYFKPVYREIWDRSTAFTKIREENLFVIYDSQRT